MEAIAGHYAHYDIVAYQESVSGTMMRTFIISYGFTDFHIENGKLIESDRFCHAQQVINQKGVTSSLSDLATQAIKPDSAQVEVFFEDGKWRVYRKATPSLIGIAGDSSLPLSMDRNSPHFTDPDKDGKPGMTVKINVKNLFTGEVYIARREIFNNHLTLTQDGLFGYVEDYSEQLVIGASSSLFDKEANPHQNEDYGLSPMILVKVDEDLDTCEELMAHRDDLFPKEPRFY